MQSLNGIRVLDFTRVLAGPFCTMLMGDMGAEVIKIESPQGGDETRHWGPPWFEADGQRESAYYLAINRSKRGITLNLKMPEGRDLARQLARKSHVLVENFKPGTMAKFGLNAETLHRENPALVYASITGFGQHGPYADRAGYDHIVQAMSGLMSITGPPDSSGSKVGVAVSDVITGLFALSGILAALREAESTGRGQHLDVALLDSQLAALVNIASGALITGATPARHGNAHANIVPYQNFRAADQDFALAVGNDSQFATLCHAIARADLIDDARASTNSARVTNRAWLAAELQAIFMQQTAAHWVDLFTGIGIPCGVINTVTQAIADPHLTARGLLHQTTFAGASLPLMGSPLTESVTLPPPTLGQHTDAVLHEVLGIDAETCADYRARGII